MMQVQRSLGGGCPKVRGFEVAAPGSVVVKRIGNSLHELDRL